MVRRWHIVAFGVGVAAIALAQSAGPKVPGGNGVGGGGVPDNVLTGYRGNGTLDFEDISPSGYSEALTISVPGSTVGSAARCNATSNIAPLIVSQWVSATDEVSIILTNTNTFSNLDPAPIEFACVITE